ncbi:hypothetical protein [Nannocystis exedens]|uniref:hypothetical protein n=1 Tax=Nannocystis exedens TaxID=54 RepID=UPI000BBA0B1E|nr:hypothetical protein [Nannocystis exedens]
MTYLLSLALAPLAGCGSNEHCIGDCESQTTSSDTAGPATSTEGGTSTTANGGTTTVEAATADTPTTSTTGGTSTTAGDITTTGAEGSLSCRDGAQCMVHCLIQVPNPAPPGYDVNECLFTNCLDELSQAEMLKLQDLQECAESTCGSMFDCAADEDDCEACVLQILGSTNPPPAGECEALAKACQ